MTISKIDNKIRIASIIQTCLLASMLIVFSPIGIIFSFKEFFIGIVIGGSIYAICFVFKNFKNLRLDKTTNNRNKKISINTYAPLLIYIPSTIVEELLLRSYVFHLLIIYFPLPLSILINSILFYCIHVDKKRIELIFSAIIYCLLVVYTNNIFPSIIAHLTYNIIAFLLINRSNGKK